MYGALAYRVYPTRFQRLRMWWRHFVKRHIIDDYPYDERTF